MNSIFPAVLQQWIDARTQLSKAIQAYFSATTLLESACTPFAINSHPGLMAAIENNLEVLGRDEVTFHRAQAALRKKRNSYISPINVLPSELLAYIFKIAVALTSPRGVSSGYDERSLSKVCSRWRQIALEVCPAWPQVSLIMDEYNIPEDSLRVAVIKLHHADYCDMDMPIHHPLGIDYALFVQTVLGTISPYIKQLAKIELSADYAEQLQPFLDFWLEKGAPGSLVELDLSAGTASLVFPEVNSHMSDRLRQFLGHISDLSLRSVGFNWSSVAFDRLTSIWLTDLPSFCCPTLAQLAQILSTCSTLHTLGLQRIMIPTSLDLVAPEPVELKHLSQLWLEEVDIARVLWAISPGRCELDVNLQGAVVDTNTLASLRSFTSRANIRKLTLKKACLGEVLVQLLDFVIGRLLDLICLTLSEIELRDSELCALASHFLPQSDHFSPSPLVDTSGGLPTLNRLLLEYCAIHTTAEAFHSAMSALPLCRLSLIRCTNAPTTQGEVDCETEIAKQIDSHSEFGIRLTELIPELVDFDYW